MTVHRRLPLTIWWLVLKVTDWNWSWESRPFKMAKSRRLKNDQKLALETAHIVKSEFQCPGFLSSSIMSALLSYQFMPIKPTWDFFLLQSGEVDLRSSISTISSVSNSFVCQVGGLLLYLKMNTWSSFSCTVLSVNMPTPHFYRKYAHPFSEGSFLKILW